MIWTVEEFSRGEWVQVWLPMRDEVLAMRRFRASSEFGRTVRLTCTQEKAPALADRG